MFAQCLVIRSILSLLTGAIFRGTDEVTHTIWKGSDKASVEAHARRGRDRKMSLRSLLSKKKKEMEWGVGVGGEKRSCGL